VCELFANDSAFAALREDGSVVTWGNPFQGGDSADIQEDLRGCVEHICPNKHAFAALTKSGSVVAWGNIYTGGDASKVQEELASEVVRIFATPSCFLAVKSDKTIVAWGEGSPDVNLKAQLTGLRHLCSNREGTAVAALRSDGSVLTWGRSDHGGDSSKVQQELSNTVDAVYATRTAFAARKSDGSVVTWGNPREGGDGCPSLSREAGKFTIVNQKQANPSLDRGYRG
jgi:alpha-tubulin suppressor-like RCC1 family protein